MRCSLAMPVFSIEEQDLTSASGDRSFGTPAWWRPWSTGSFHAHIIETGTESYRLRTTRSSTAGKGAS
jgi:hypothetical protein